MAMSSDQWEIVKALFESAQELPAERVPAFLADKSSDPVVRAEVSVGFSPNWVKDGDLPLYSCIGS